MRLAIFGSRSLIGDDVRKVIRKQIVEVGATLIVTAGEPQGACNEARHVSQETSIPLKLHWLKAKERAAGKYHHRSVAVLKDCDFCLFLYDGKSAGTRNEIKVAEKLKVNYRVELLSPVTDDFGIMQAIRKIKEAQ